jgi:hypothetical protein
MAGTPIRRARREQREARERGNRRFDDLAREAVLERAEEVGPTVAAREVGISPGTIRTWRKRRADTKPVPIPVAQPDDLPTTPAVRLRAQAERARAASSRALDQSDSMLRRGLATEARNASVVAGVNADRAQELERTAREQEKHEQRLTDQRAEQVVELIRAMFTAIDLNLPHDLARAVLRGEEVTPELRDQARAQVDRQVRAELRVEVRAELEAQRPALPTEEVESNPTEAEPNPTEDLALSFDQLPPEWQHRYALNRGLGVHEYTLAAKREERQQAEHGGRPPRRSPPPSFRHPALESAGW